MPSKELIFSSSNVTHLATERVDIVPFSLHFGNYIDGMSRSDRPEIIDDRVGNKATIFTSLDRRTLAFLDRRGDYRDAILDRPCSAITASR